MFYVKKKKNADFTCSVSSVSQHIHFEKVVKMFIIYSLVIKSDLSVPISKLRNSNFNDQLSFVDDDKPRIIMVKHELH